MQGFSVSASNKGCRLALLLLNGYVMHRILLSVLTVAVVFVSACTYTLRIQNGAMALERKQYAVAVDMLRREYNKADSRVERGRIAYQLGQAYQGLNQGADAISWFKIAYDNQVGFEALRSYAYALKQAERYEDARQAFIELGLEIGSPYEYRKEIQACEQAARWLKTPAAGWSVSSLPLNTAAAEYAVGLLPDGRMLFSSDRAGAAGEDTYLWTGRGFSDLFVAAADGGGAQPLPPPINTEANEGSAFVTADGQELFFTRCAAPKGSDAYCQLFYSRQAAGGDWEAPRLLDFVKPGFNYMHPCLSADKRTLFFASNHTDGWGGYDIYTAERQPDGSWKEPVVLSRNINTPDNEQFPWIDGDTLYFASNGHYGMGGLDVYKSWRTASGAWVSPRNLEAPVNSGGDDFAFVIDRRASLPQGVVQRAFVSSNRADGQGGDDVYLLEKKWLPPPPPPPAAAVVFSNRLNVFVLEKVYREADNPNSAVIGRRPLPAASLRIGGSGISPQQLTVDEEGKYSLLLPKDAVLDFMASAAGYLRQSASFSAVNLPEDTEKPEQVYELEIVLDKIFVGKEVRLENIYYDFDQSFIREDAKPTLAALAQLLIRNPEIRIQLSSHTDCRGSDTYNEQLSQRRAQAAVDYLIELGIAPGRLTAKGYGESLPANTCACNRCTEDEHQYNRRTTFTIVE